MQHPELLVLGIAVLILAALLLLDRASSGQHVWSPGAAMRAPAGDPMTVTRHAWRPGAGEDTIRVDVLVRRIDAEARLVALARKQRNKVDALVRRLTEPKGGRHRLAEDPPAGGEGQADEDTGPLCTHPPLFPHAAAA